MLLPTLACLLEISDAFFSVTTELSVDNYYLGLNFVPIKIGSEFLANIQSQKWRKVVKFGTGLVIILILNNVMIYVCEFIFTV